MAKAKDGRIGCISTPPGLDSHRSAFNSAIIALIRIVKWEQE